MIKLTIFVLCVISVQTHVSGDELGVACTSTEDCYSVVGSVCQMGRCACAKGQVLSSDLARCIPVSENYGVECDDNAQCAGRLSAGGECTAAGTCACKQGYHYLHGKCWLSVGLNSSCYRSEQCFENHNYESLSCNSGKCGCAGGFYMRGFTHCRREGTVPGAECTFDLDCRNDGGDGKCSNNTCVFVARQPSVNQQLTRREEVETPPGPSHHLERRDAVTCVDDADCVSALGPHGECNTASTCWCAPGYYSVGDASQCLPELGERCTDDADCGHMNFTVCRNKESADGYCSCSVRYTPSADNRQCLLLRKMELNCLKVAESCLNYGPLAECDDESGWCLCNKESHFEDDYQMCWASRGINEACTESRDCMTASGARGVDCDLSTNTCQCINGYHEAKGDCRKDATALGQSCVDDEDCLMDNARCNAKSCACQCGYYAQDGDDDVATCVPGIGAPCSSPEDCPLKNSVCEDNAEMCFGNKTFTTTTTTTTSTNITTCTCNITANLFVPSLDWSACLKVSSKYGDACKEGLQCKAAYGSNSDCIENRCLCEENYHLRDNFCWPIIELGQKCSRTSECYLVHDSETSECRNGKCECLYEYEQNDAGNECISGSNMLTSAMATIVAAIWISSTLK